MQQETPTEAPVATASSVAEPTPTTAHINRSGPERLAKTKFYRVALVGSSKRTSSAGPSVREWVIHCCPNDLRRISSAFTYAKQVVTQTKVGIPD